VTRCAGQGAAFKITAGISAIIVGLTTAHGSGAGAQTFVVDANLHSISRSPSSPGLLPFASPLDTGVNVNRGDLLTITAAGSWTISGSDPFTGPDGQIGRTIHSGVGWFAGALLFQISDTPRSVRDAEWDTRTFVAGSSFSGPAPRTGRLFLAFNDTNFGDNAGSVIANVSIAPAAVAAPEPATARLALVGCLACCGRIRRNRLVASAFAGRRTGDNYPLARCPHREFLSFLSVIADRLI
jgi:hypothetical protein